MTKSKPRKPRKLSPTPFDEYRVRDAVSTMQRAEEIRSDKALHSAVKKEAKRQQKALDKVAKK